MSCACMDLFCFHDNRRKLEQTGKPLEMEWKVVADTARGGTCHYAIHTELVKEETALK